jgi:hypothetical protein
VDKALSHLVEHVANVGLRLAEPHGQKFRALDRDEVGLALVGDGLCQERLTATGWPVEEHAAAGTHAKLEEFLRVLHRVL